MNRPKRVTVRPVGQWFGGRLVGSSDVIVIAVDPAAPSDGTLDLWYRAGTRPPAVGERIGTYVDGNTTYALAPRAA